MILSEEPVQNFHVRALFSYDPAEDHYLPSKGLPFQFGDVLHVVNAADPNWWQARLVFSYAPTLPASATAHTPRGIIPSPARWIGKERTRRKKVNFQDKTEIIGAQEEHNEFAHSGSGTSLDLKRARRAKLEGSSASGDVDPASILTYEVVDPIPAVLSRPILVFGPVREKVYDLLLKREADKFATCVPHTTRPRRSSEENGVDYHFVIKSEDMEAQMKAGQFLELGRYNGNLYGTSVAAVQTVAESGRHCLLDVTAHALTRLHTAHLAPLVVLVRSTTVEEVRALNPKKNPEQAVKEIEQCLWVEKEFPQYLTAVISGGSVDEVYQKLNEIINENPQTKLWRRSANQTQIALTT